MKRMDSFSASVILLLACVLKVGCETNAQPAKNNSTIPSETINTMLQRSMRDSYRRPDLPIFGEEDIKTRISNHNTRNRTRDDDVIRHDHQVPIQTATKKSSSKKSSSSATSSSRSSKKSSKREGTILFPTHRPTSLPTTTQPTMTPATALPTSSSVPTTSSMPTISPSEIHSPTDQPTRVIPTRDPTPGPTPRGTTSAPTAEPPGFPIEASTYSLNFFFDNTSGNIETTDEDFVQLGEVTQLYFDDYFDRKYGSTFIISFKEALTQVVGFSALSLPIETFFFTTVIFSETSIFYPPLSEVEREIEKAFITFGSNFEYLMAVRGLPTSNAFQTVSSVSWVGFGGG
ncbi:unnamed protein product [Cylindrotheca closterium]|uniref:Subtilisin n=1 Tax=Cylindrotheca closterium TaxID=2856 RepID=A0AAD2CLT5_9STRA|nr:unnamed protein product [Cylindrotheca closterium]